MNTRKLFLCMAGVAALLLNATAAWADVAGHIQFVHGDVRIINASGVTHALNKGDAINEGDTISSAKAGTAQVKMVDGGFIAVRQDTQLKIDSYKFATKEGQPENSFFSLVKGSFRAVTGLIGRINRKSYRITTPVATIGIRGTDHETAYVPIAMPGVPAGAYSKVNVGETSLTTNAGTVNVKPNQMGFAGGITRPPKLLPINTNLFTVAAAPAKEAKVIGAKDKEEKADDQGPQTAQKTDGQEQTAQAGDQGGDNAGTTAGTGNPEPIRDNAVVDNTSEGAGIQASVSIAPAVTDTTTTTNIAPPQTTIPVTATNDSLVLDTTNQTVSAGSGSPPAPVQNGTFDIQAKTAADAALVAANAASAAATAATAAGTQLAAITVVSTTPATTAIATADGTIATAAPLVTSATAITPVNATTASSTAQAAATAAASKAAAAQAALSANSAFADVLAGPANTATADANAALQSANSSIQSAAATVSTQNAALTTAQAAANSALATANTNLTAANAALDTANTNNTSITTAQNAASGLASQAATAASLAQSAASAAQAAADLAASLQTAGDFTGAAAQLAIAQQQQTIAQQQLAIAQSASTALSNQLPVATTAQTNANNAVTAAVSSANTAAANAGTGATGAQTLAAAAQTAAANASTALASTSSQLAVVTSNAATVAANAPIAAYNNPAVASNFIGHTMMPVPGASSGYNLGESPDNPPVVNTTYVLDGSGNLVEARDISFNTSSLQDGNSIGTPIAHADITWTNGTASESFKLPDNSVYGGRWENATVTVTDLSNSAVTAYTPKDSLWAVLLPPSVGYVQSLTGTTTYTMAGHTTPYDALGNLGTLNTATLVADFTNQWVDAAVNLTMGAASPMAGTFDVASGHMPIENVASTNPSGFGSNNVLTANCTGTCAGNATGYSANVGGSFAGTQAASAGLAYSIWPTTSAGTSVTDMVQGLVAFTADSTPTSPTVAAQVAADAAAVVATAAQTAANAAAAANTNLTGIALASTTPATAAIGTATTAIGTATTAVSTATALSTADAAAAAANASAAQTAATAAADAAAAAQSALAANGAFADTTAASANTAVQNANSSLQAANALAQAAAGDVVTRNAALTSAQDAASTALGNAGTSLSTASSSLATADAQNSAIITAQSIATTPLTAAQTAAANAAAAATAAQAAATLAASYQAAGDFANAQAQLLIAQQQLAIAQAEQANTQAAATAVATQLANAQSAQAAASAAVTAAANAAATASSDAATASTQASAAQTVATSAGIAVNLSTSQLAEVTSNAATVAANAPIAAYNNPAVATDFIGATMLSTAVSGGFNAGFTPDTPLQSNTNYVLDGSGNLVEMRVAPFQIQSNQNGDVLTPAITGVSGADIKWSGGTAADTFKLADNSIYMGRWENPTITVTDNTTPANVYTYTPLDNVWIVLLPPPAGYVQSLTATSTYTMAGHTTPVDAFGNPGFLNNATLSADFTNQLVDAAVSLTMSSGSMAGTFDVTGTSLPIQGSGFGVPDASYLTTVCSAGTCAAGASGYSADLGGNFAGDLAGSAAISYNLWPTTALPTDSASNAVQGFVAFTTATLPTVSSGGPYAAYAATGTAVAYTGAYGGGFNFIAAPGELTPLANPTTFTESYGNGSGYRTDVLNGATGSIPTTTANGITFGVWESVASVSATEHHVIMPGNGGGTAHGYMYGAEGYLDSAVNAGVQTGPLVGTFGYTNIAMTSYDNNSNNWAAGTATSATMSADFTNQTVDVALGGTMGTTSWTSASNGMPINFFELTTGTGASFNSSAPDITVDSVVCGSCGGNINGSFIGQNYAGAIVQYDVWDNNGNLNVDGLVALDRLSVGGNPAVSNGTPNPSMTTYVLANNAYNVERPTTITTDGGVLTGWSVDINNATVAPAVGSVAQTPVGSGSGTINWGEWAAGSVADNNFSYTPGTTQLHWITAPEPTPVYLSDVLIATNAVYNFLDGDVTSLTGGGVHGSINSGTSLTVNFMTQSVAVNLDLTVNGHDWLATTPDASLEWLNNSESRTAFYADSYRFTSQPGYLTVTVDGTAANGNLAGQLVGTALDGSFLKFNLDGQVATPTPSYEWVQGVAALGAAVANDPLTPYRIAIAMVNDPIVTNGGDPMAGGYQALSKVAFDGTGNLTKLSDKATIELSGGTSGSAFTGTSSSAGAPCSPCTDGVTGIQWGRWEPGVTATVTEGGVIVDTPSIGGGGLHWIASPEFVGPVTLPVSGTYAYTVAGGTNPTDSAGAVGTLTSASLSANFDAQTVDVGVDVVVPTATISASANNVPISKGALFDANSMNGLSVVCSGTACGAPGTPMGEIAGGFGGAGAIGAVMAYGFLPNPAVANMITGVVAFQR
ncbi:MAG: FecR family protein [Georgfuchsia sp.]